MKIFVTGGTGFIGTQVVKKLTKENHNLFVLSKNLANIDKWKNELRKFKPEVAVHMAWEGIPNYSSKMSIKNLEYGVDLFRVLVKAGCPRVVSTGSCWEYGLNKGKLNEDLPVRPLSAFTAAKNALHWLGKEIAKENKGQFIWTRLFFVYGHGQRKDSLIPYIINCVQQGKRPAVKTPLARNDFVYVEDVAEAIVDITNNAKKSGVYNIGSGKATSVQEIVKMVYKKFNRPYREKDKLSKPAKSPSDDFWADISKIKREIGWQPKTNIKKGIQKTIDYQQNGKL